MERASGLESILPVVGGQTGLGWRGEVVHTHSLTRGWLVTGWPLLIFVPANDGARGAAPPSRAFVRSRPYQTPGPRCVSPTHSIAGIAGAVISWSPCRSVEYGVDNNWPGNRGEEHASQHRAGYLLRSIHAHTAHYSVHSHTHSTISQLFSFPSVSPLVLVLTSHIDNAHPHLTAPANEHAIRASLTASCA